MKKKKYPIAHVNINLAFISQKLIAAKLSYPCANVILGNIKNLKCTQEVIQELCKIMNVKDKYSTITKNMSNVSGNAFIIIKCHANKCKLLWFSI